MSILGWARAPNLIAVDGRGDPEDFPFTEDEVYRAERLLSSDADQAWAGLRADLAAELRRRSGSLVA